MTVEAARNATASKPDELRWFEQPEWRWAFSNILVWLLPALLAFGIVFNLICLVTIILNRKLFPKIARQNMLLITSCDAVVLAVCGTYLYHKGLKLTMLRSSPIPTLMDYRHNSFGSCISLQYLIEYLITGTPFFHVSLTLERVLAVVLPLKVKEIVTVKRNFALLFVLALLGSLRPAIWAAMHTYENGRCLVRDSPTNLLLDEWQFNLNFYLSRLALFVLLLTGCIIVAAALNLQAKKTAQLSNGVTDKTRINRNSLTCAVMILMNVIFFVSQGPKAIMSVYEGHAVRQGFMFLTEAELDLIHESLTWMTFLHNLANPFAYLLGKSFRMALKELLLKASNTCRFPNNQGKMSSVSDRNTAATQPRD